jgi:hypothetical protein
MDQVDAAFDKSDFITAKSLLAVVRTMIPKDAYVAQRLALATYKSKLPTPEVALNEAATILDTLEPESSTDTETLGLYGAVRKRLWEATGVPAHLDKAIWAHEKGFYVKNDYYNGINLALLLNVRSARSADSQPAEAIADFVTAQRIRRRVLTLCQALLDSSPMPTGPDWYWIKATIAEAYLGLGDEAKGREVLDDAKAHLGVAAWMIQSTEEQLLKPRGLLADSPLSRINSRAIA